LRRISLACQSFRFSRSKALSRAAMSVVGPGLRTVLLVVAPPSQELEPTTNPGRFLSAAPPRPPEISVMRNSSKSLAGLSLRTTCGYKFRTRNVRFYNNQRPANVGYIYLSSGVGLDGPTKSSARSARRAILRSSRPRTASSRRCTDRARGASEGTTESSATVMP
jgi:hypothetical protein